MAYELHYWPTIPGRGEFVRLALEASGTPYLDMARTDEGAGLERSRKLMNDRRLAHPPFAMPFLKDGDIVVAQVAAILQYLAPTLKLVARNEQARIWTHQIQLTLADLVAEVHATHHPLSSGLTYGEQRDAAAHAARAFCGERLPKYLGWLESVVARNPGGQRYLVGGKLSYADLSLFQVIEGLAYAFPRASASVFRRTPHLLKIRDRVASLPRVAAYVRSERRLPFNEDGIFRHYPELDSEAAA